MSNADHAGGIRDLARMTVDLWFRYSAMKKLDISIVPAESGGTYPRPFDEPCIAQSCQRLARYAGLTQFGVNVTVIEAGAWSSQRHWHSHEDEFVWVLEGELTLVTDAGEET